VMLGVGGERSSGVVGGVGIGAGHDGEGGDSGEDVVLT